MAEIWVSCRNGCGLRQGEYIGGVRRRVATSLVTIRRAMIAAPTWSPGTSTASSTGRPLSTGSRPTPAVSTVTGADGWAAAPSGAGGSLTTIITEPPILSVSTCGGTPNAFHTWSGKDSSGALSGSERESSTTRRP